jgi:hypothetical protein
MDQDQENIRTPESAPVSEHDNEHTPRQRVLELDSSETSPANNNAVPGGLQDNVHKSPVKVNRESQKAKQLSELSEEYVYATHPFNQPQPYDTLLITLAWIGRWYAEMHNALKIGGSETGLPQMHPMIPVSSGSLSLYVLYSSSSFYITLTSMACSPKTVRQNSTKISIMLLKIAARTERRYMPCHH